MSSEEHEQFRKAILKRREKAAIKQTGMPYLVPGMSHNAVAVELRRAVRRMEVSERIMKADEEKRRIVPPPQDDNDRAGEIARKLLMALQNGGEMKAHAERYLKTAHPHIKEKLLELEDADSEFKKRRSRKTNGY